jgi:hypothetical protein
MDWVRFRDAVDIIEQKGNYVAANKCRGRKEDRSAIDCELEQTVEEDCEHRTPRFQSGAPKLEAHSYTATKIFHLSTLLSLASCYLSVKIYYYSY